MKKTFAGLAVAALAALALYVAVKPGTTHAPGAPNAGEGASLPTGGYSEHAPSYDIAANYPATTTLQGPANGAAVALMRDFVAQTIRDFKASEANASAPQAGTPKRSVEIAYLIGSSAHTLSYIFTVYERGGGAHDALSFRTFVFDASTGAHLSLGDLFVPGAPYLDTLSRIARERLPGILGAGRSSDAAISRGIVPNEENFSNFFFDNNYFVVLFSPSQVASYSLGPQTLRIPLSDLSDILKAPYRTLVK